MRNDSLEAPLLGLGNEIPDELYVISHPSSERYGCFLHNGTHGLAVFSNAIVASTFCRYIDLGGLVIEQTSFDAARETAKNRPLPVVAVMLLDDIQRPVVHFVR